MFLYSIDIMSKMKKDQWEQEEENFKRMRQEFIEGKKYQEYSGKIVAVYNDNIIGSGYDVTELANEVFKEHSERKY